MQNWCRTCAAKKSPAPKNQAPLTSIKVGEPLQVLAVGLLGPFPESENGNKYILVVGDYFIRWMESYAIKNLEATTDGQILFLLLSSPPIALRPREAMKYVNFWASQNHTLHPATRRVMGWLSGSIVNYLPCYLQQQKPIRLIGRDNCGVSQVCTQLLLFPPFPDVWEAGTHTCGPDVWTPSIRNYRRQHVQAPRRRPVDRLKFCPP